MNLMAMSYKDFLFPQNPTSLEVTEARTVKEAVLPFAGTALQDLGPKRRRVTGEGYFTGPGCWADWNRLQHLYAQGGPGSLRLPGQKPFLALLDSLRLVGVSGKELVKYTFAFTEVRSAGPFSGAGEYRSAAGESLWDYARRYQRSIDLLVAANPHLRDMEELAEGEKVVVP